jgi:hypothetical protein
LPIEAKTRYFDIEKKLLQLKKQFDAGKLPETRYRKQIQDQLKIFGSDPVEKIDPCFMVKFKVPFRKYFEL